MPNDRTTWRAIDGSTKGAARAMVLLFAAAATVGTTVRADPADETRISWRFHSIRVDESRGLRPDGNTVVFAAGDTFSAPSVNSRGDLIFWRRPSGNGIVEEEVWARFYNRGTRTYWPLARFGIDDVFTSVYPAINDQGWGSTTIQTLNSTYQVSVLLGPRPADANGPGFGFLVPIAYARVGEPNDSDPFTRILNFTGIGEGGGLNGQDPPLAAFFGEAPLSPVGGTGYFAANSLLNRSTARDARVVSSIDGNLGTVTPYLDLAGTPGHAFLAYYGAGQGVYLAERAGADRTVTPVGRGGDEPLATGERPGVNASGAVAFTGEWNGIVGAWIRFPGGRYRFAGAAGPDGMPLPGANDQVGSVTRTDKVSINRHGQVAFVATDPQGRRALYSSGSGSLRRVIGVGDRLQADDAQSEVTGLICWDGMMDSGQVVFRAQTLGGPRLIRASRAAWQVSRPVDGPFDMPWGTRGYLLREQGCFGGNNGQQSIAFIGCNLTSLANALRYFGVDTDPGALQDFAIEGWQRSREGEAWSFISCSNDIPEEVVSA